MKKRFLSTLVVNLMLGSTVAWAAVPEGSTDSATDASNITTTKARAAHEVVVPETEQHTNIQGNSQAPASSQTGRISRKQLRRIEAAYDLTQKDFSTRNLAGVEFKNRDLTGASFQDCNLTASNFRKADLTRANFRGATLIGADMTRSVLVEADFRHTDLRHADFRGAFLQNARYDKHTLLPTGFAPEKHGMIYTP